VNRRAPAALLLLLLFDCHRAIEAPQTATSIAAPAPAADANEHENLASLANGGAVVDRTGEAYLDVSAVNLIDSNPQTYWLNPPHDLPQSVTIALAAPSRVARVGLRTVPGGDFAVRKAAVEVSTDGHTFKPLGDVTPKNGGDVQFFDFPPTDATHVRVTVISGPVKDHDLRLDSIVVRGIETAALTRAPLAGAWRVNGRATALAQRGNHVTGTMEMGTVPMRLEGGFDRGRMLRLLYLRGNDYGLAAVGISPDGRHLSGLTWHEEPIPLFHGDSWFGEAVTQGPVGRQAPSPVRLSDDSQDRRGRLSPHGTAGDATDARQFAIDHLRRTGRYPLFGLAFRDDATLDAAGSDDALAIIANLAATAPVPLRVVSHEFREATPQANRARAQRALDALRSELARRGVNVSALQWITLGSDHPRQDADTDTVRALYSSIDLEIRR
jgi:hypothetical protein